MKTLRDYTDEELREELKRRVQESRKKHEITYIEFEATICEVDNFSTVRCKRNGDRMYKPFVFWKYRLKDCSLE